MRAIVTGRGILVVGTALLAAAGMCACSANQTPNGTGRGNGQLTTSAATASGPAAAPSEGAPNTTTGPSAVQNLVISSTEKSELTAAFVAYKRISLSDMIGADPMPGSVYYAYDPATEIYWAMASFATSSTASFNAQVSFQDGGNMGLFRKTHGAPGRCKPAACALYAPNCNSSRRPSSQHGRCRHPRRRLARHVKAVAVRCRRYLSI